MNVRDITDDATLRMYRKEAKEMGHRMSRLNTAQHAIASCMNEGCTVMVQIYGRNMGFRWINLSTDSSATNEPCQGVRPDA